MTQTIRDYQEGDAIHVIYPTDFPYSLEKDMVESAKFVGEMKEDDHVLLQLANGLLVVVQSIDLEHGK